MKKINLLLFIALSIHITVVYSADAPVYDEKIIDILKRYPKAASLLQDKNATEKDINDVLQLAQHLQSNKHSIKDSAYTISATIEGTAIVESTKKALKTGSYKQLFDFLETSPYFSAHLKNFNTHFTWARYKHIPYIVCMAVMTYTIFFKRSMLTAYIRKISNTKHGQNFIRNSLALLIFPPLAYKTYSSYKDVSVIQHIAYILNELTSNKQNNLQALKNRYCPE